MFQELLPGISPESEFDAFNLSGDTDNGGLSPQLCNYALTKWLDNESKARMLVSSDMVVRWMSNKAEKLVEAGIIRIREGHLVPRSVMVSNLLHNCTTDAYNCAISMDCQQRAWVVWARRLCEPPISLIGLIFNPPRLSSRFEALVDTHTLTPTEGRVVEMLLNGFETGRIAQSLNISSQTLKTHIKHIYSKLGVKSRGDLFAQAAGFARP
ncbi:helix-turn-helix transcriptional regulator [Brevundimonas sp. BH3]|uniref:helix-turn-helix transcriptional regulator n=1 Tax=unclassified Brevundimonas TaxID=2622653 RepID=UPI00289A8467|nr:helix-turn-helix transcriptional regulator [Brevundimonas sp.]